MAKKSNQELASLEWVKNLYAMENAALKENVAPLQTAKDEATLDAIWAKNELETLWAEMVELKKSAAHLEAVEAKAASLAEEDKALIHAAPTHNYGFAAQALASHHRYRDALGYVGAEPCPSLMGLLLLRRFSLNG